jgi:hypothetical protein
MEAVSSSQASEIIESVSSPGVVQDSLRDVNAKMPTPEELSTVESKVATARGKKDTGDAAFKAGDVKSGESRILGTCRFGDPAISCSIAVLS